MEMNKPEARDSAKTVVQYSANAGKLNDGGDRSPIESLHQSEIKRSNLVTPLGGNKPQHSRASSILSDFYPINATPNNHPRAMAHVTSEIKKQEFEIDNEEDTEMSMHSILLKSRKVPTRVERQKNVVKPMEWYESSLNFKIPSTD